MHEWRNVFVIIKQAKCVLLVIWRCYVSCKKNKFRSILKIYFYLYAHTYFHRQIFFWCRSCNIYSKWYTYVKTKCKIFSRMQSSEQRTSKFEKQIKDLWAKAWNRKLLKNIKLLDFCLKYLFVHYYHYKKTVLTKIEMHTEYHPSTWFENYRKYFYINLYLISTLHCQVHFFLYDNQNKLRRTIRSHFK